MMVLDGSHVHHAAGAWPVLAAGGLFLLAGLCAAILLLRRRTSGLASPTGQGGPCGVGHEAPLSGFDACVATRRPETADHAEDDYDSQYDFDAKILAMLSQKGEPMRQSEIAENLGMDLEELGSWLAGMEQRDMLRRAWDPAQSVYVVHLSVQT